MSKNRPSDIEIKRFDSHHVITQPNPLRSVLRRIDAEDQDDPVGRAEAALAELSGEFKNWMNIEVDRLSLAYAAVQELGWSDNAREELFRAAHDIKGDAATFGYPSAAVTANSLCRIIEHAPDLAAVPPELILNHINAVLAIVHDHTDFDATVVAAELNRRLRKVADDYLAHVNRNRPEHLEAILGPSIVPEQ